jgi:hypothetical protein
MSWLIDVACEHFFLEALANAHAFKYDAVGFGGAQ